MISVFVLSQLGLKVAEKLRQLFPALVVYGKAGRVDPVDIVSADIVADMRTQFRAGHTIIGVCASGIVIRALAPLMSDKHTEPAVLAMSEDGLNVVPLLGGHHGANDLARTIAQHFGGLAAITTASEVQGRSALDQPDCGWVLAGDQDVKPFAAELLTGATVTITDLCPDYRAARDWIKSLPEQKESRLKMTLSDKLIETSDLLYLSKNYVLGLGCERGVGFDELEKLALATCQAAGIAIEQLAAITSIDLKMDEVAINQLAAQWKVPLVYFDAVTLEAETPRLINPSEVVFFEVGCHGVAEASALAGVGQEGQLIIPKQKSARATAALAQSIHIVELDKKGKKRGHLSVVGIGPGRADWRSPAASLAVAQADVLVGYGLYLDLLGDLAAHKERQNFELGDETLRVRAALDLAASGRNVALISSGDAGIYAMAALVFEEIETSLNPLWPKVSVEVIPGISALQAAASRMGAPLGHDFCAISLSDLLTPWPTIEKRLEAAALGDFVVALYNPVSKRRREQLPIAKDILLRHRPANTPVILARNLGRLDEKVRVVTLAELHVDDVDMLTLVMIGSSTTRLVARGDGGQWVYTPRGYDVKKGQISS